MLAKRLNLGRLLTAAAVAGCLVSATAVLPAVAAPPGTAFTKYYLVAAKYQGQPENLTEIAVRFLGSASRSADIYNLNAGRAQPDGSSLTDPTRLDSGWYLVLPWDAVGGGVQYGQVPSGRAPAPSAPRTPGTPKPVATSPQPGTRSSPSATASTAAGCTTTSASSTRSDWAQLRLAVDGAWDVSRGNGVMVAVVDSGVDGKLSQLSGRLTVGADVTVGNGKGNTDCLGTGTAMAAIVAANADAGETPVGMAPDATILPVRMVGTAPSGRPADAANAIEVAVSAGASVVALGGYVDLSAPEVATALRTALDHDVIIVAAAPTEPLTIPSAADSSATGALLLVGGVDAAGQPIEQYQPNTVEVAAPGADVESIGPGKDGVLSYTGSRYAVAFVAGEAALVRAAYPNLNAEEVKKRITQTADLSASASPAGGTGAGFIDPTAAVASSSGAAGMPAAAAQGGDQVAAVHGSSKRGIAALFCLGFVLVAAGGSVAFWLVRRRSMA